MEPAELVDLAVAAAHRAGALLLDRFRSPSANVTAKSTPTDLVSDADRDSEAAILEVIRSERPDDGVLSEEGAPRSGSGLTWVIDPLDGTVNYLFGLPVWAVSIAATDDRGTVLGVVYDPSHDETFTALRGEGAFLNGRPVAVSRRSELSDALIGTGFAYDARVRSVQADLLRKVLPRARDIRRAGAAAIDLASTACARLDGFYEAPVEVWDKAAGVLLVEEAGGTVSELEAPFGFSPGVVAAGPHLHDELRRLILG